MTVDLLVKIIEVAALVVLYVGLVCAIGVVVSEARDDYPEPFEQPSHVRVLRGDES